MKTKNIQGQFDEAEYESIITKLRRELERSEKYLDESRASKRQFEKHISQLIKERSKLLEVNQTKDDFISLASHQLRTPASAVKQYLSMLQTGFAGDTNAEQMDFICKAYACNERQLKIIDDLLKVAMVDAGRVSIKNQVSDLVALLREVVHEQSSVQSNKHQKVIINTSNKSVTAYVDPDLIRMVLENILSNASKYSKMDQQITIDITELEDEAEIRIADSGIGISNRDLPKLFYKFSRIENPLSASISGTGLGLYLSKKIIDLHNGSIAVKSIPNHGSTFVITLPKDSQKLKKKAEFNKIAYFSN